MKRVGSHSGAEWEPPLGVGWQHQPQGHGCLPRTPGHQKLGLLGYFRVREGGSSEDLMSIVS